MKKRKCDSFIKYASYYGLVGMVVGIGPQTMHLSLDNEMYKRFVGPFTLG